MNNLDLGARQINGELTEGTSWTPIGINYNNVDGHFGTFDGNNYSIKGIYVKNINTFSGLFGSSNTIQNLTIKNSYIGGSNITGGIVGFIISGKMYKCHNINTTVKGTLTTGGLVGLITGEIKECSNKGIVIGNVGGNITGGIAGNATTISECSNNGTITGENYIGGIGGSATTISKSGNSGTITGGKYVGGIGGTATTISECSNKGIITGMDNVGGIVGTCFSGERQDISLCYSDFRRFLSQCYRIFLLTHLPKKTIAVEVQPYRTFTIRHEVHTASMTEVNISIAVRVIFYPDHIKCV